MAEGAPRRLPGQASTRRRGQRTHLCCSCDFPIAVYGRCAPCTHVYCLTCAAGMARCIICGAAITKLERIPAEAGLFISPLTLQGFKTEADLAAHAQKVWPRLQAALGMGGDGAMGMAPMGMQQGMQAMVGRGMQGMAYYGQQQQQQQQQQQAGSWKPPPPPGPPPGAPGYAGQGGPQQRSSAQGGPRHGQGSVMRPR